MAICQEGTMTTSADDQTTKIPNYKCNKDQPADCGTAAFVDATNVILLLIYQLGPEAYSHDFCLRGCTLFFTKTLMTVFSRHPLLHGHIRHILSPTTLWLGHGVRNRN